MMNYYYGWGGIRPIFGFGWIFGVIFWIFFAFLVIGLIRLFVRGHRDNDFDEGEERGDKALGILKERYAKGEITKKEFLEMKKDIS